jgi:hypothetical protein
MDVIVSCPCEQLLRQRIIRRREPGRDDRRYMSRADLSDLPAARGCGGQSCTKLQGCAHWRPQTRAISQKPIKRPRHRAPLAQRRTVRAAPQRRARGGGVARMCCRHRRLRSSLCLVPPSSPRLHSENCCRRFVFSFRSHSADCPSGAASPLRGPLSSGVLAARAIVLVTTERAVPPLRI